VPENLGEFFGSFAYSGFFLDGDVGVGVFPVGEEV
jgi:hypothetical protein